MTFFLALALFVFAAIATGSGDHIESTMLSVGGYLLLGLAVIGGKIDKLRNRQQ